MIQDISPQDAEKLTKIWSLIHQAYDLMEDIRPAGGWKERIDNKYCKECGKSHE